MKTVQKAVLLAAGRGTRLGSLTDHLPKPMVRVQGVPVLEHILRGLRDGGITEALLVVGYRAEAIRDYFGAGERVGIALSYVHQATPNGTGAALLLGRAFAAEGAVLATYGDILTDPAHYRAVLDEGAACLARGGGAVIGINPVDDPAAGSAVYREGSRVRRVVEKPPPGTAVGCWNIAGVSVFGGAVWGCLAALTPSPRGEYELTDAIGCLLDANREVRAVELRGFWSDIGTPEALAHAETHYAARL
jgi:dTDP-glucose pyrophosphorylase